MGIDINKNGIELKNTDKQLPVSIFDLIKEVNEKILNIKDSSDYIIKSSGLIIDIDSKGCKGYCMGKNNIPNICGKGEQCKNFGRASQILKKINEFQNNQNLKNIY